MIEEFQTWLGSFQYDWSKFTVADCAKYLGMLIGPSVTNEIWAQPLAKFKRRVAGLASAGAPT